MITTLLLLNNATVWPPSLMAYVPMPPKNVCPLEIDEYKWLGVGENATIPKQTICLTYSPIGLVWQPPERYNATSHLLLEAKIEDRELIFWVSEDPKSFEVL